MILYTKDNCPACEMVKKVVPSYIEQRNVDEKEQYWMEWYMACKEQGVKRTVPALIKGEDEDAKVLSPSSAIITFLESINGISSVRAASEDNVPDMPVDPADESQCDSCQ